MTIQEPVVDDATLKQRVGAYLKKVTGFDVEVGAMRRFPVGFSWRTYLVPVRGLSGDGAASDLASNEDVKEFYLGVGGGERKSFKDVKSYKRRKRWLA